MTHHTFQLFRPTLLKYKQGFDSKKNSKDCVAMKAVITQPIRLANRSQCSQRTDYKEVAQRGQTKSVLTAHLSLTNTVHRHIHIGSHFTTHIRPRSTVPQPDGISWESILLWKENPGFVHLQNFKNLGFSRAIFLFFPGLFLGSLKP